MHIDRDELLLLSRAGRVPRASRPPRLPVARPQSLPHGRPGRLVTLARRLSRPPRRPAELDTHQYLRLEFAVDDERATEARR